MEGSGRSLYRDNIRIFVSDKTEENHEAVRRYSFLLSQDFAGKTRTLTPTAPPTRFVLRNFFLIICGEIVSS